MSWNVHKKREQRNFSDNNDTVPMQRGTVSHHRIYCSPLESSAFQVPSSLLSHPPYQVSMHEGLGGVTAPPTHRQKPSSAQPPSVSTAPGVPDSTVGGFCWMGFNFLPTSSSIKNSSVSNHLSSVFSSIVDKELCVPSAEEARVQASTGGYDCQAPPGMQTHSLEGGR